MLTISNYLVLSLFFLHIVAKAIDTMLFRHYAWKIMESLSMTTWKSFDEIVQAAGCPHRQARRILVVFIYRQAVDIRFWARLNDPDPEVQERVSKLPSCIHSSAEVFEYRLKIRPPRKRVRSPVEHSSPTWVPAPA